LRISPDEAGSGGLLAWLHIQSVHGGHEAPPTWPICIPVVRA